MKQLKEEYAISVVVDLNDTKAEGREAEHLGLKYFGKKLPMVPTVAAMESMAKTIDREIREGRKVFVHCHEGRYRAPTIATAYLIYKGMKIENAVKQVRARRPSALPGLENSQRLMPALGTFEKKVLAGPRETH